MKNVGIAGLPGAGSSTIFTALTALEGAAPGKSNQAVVPVPDERARAILEAGKPLREEKWDDLELAAFQGMALLTLKPVVVVANVDEDSAGKPLSDGMVPVAGALEAEVAGMDPAEATELLESY